MSQFADKTLVTKHLFNVPAFFPWDFPGGPGLRPHLPMQGVWVWSLVAVLRSHMLCSQKTKTKTKSHISKSNIAINSAKNFLKSKKKRKPQGWQVSRLGWGLGNMGTHLTSLCLTSSIKGSDTQPQLPASHTRRLRRGQVWDSRIKSLSER